MMYDVMLFIVQRSKEFVLPFAERFIGRMVGQCARRVYFTGTLNQLRECNLSRSLTLITLKVVINSSKIDVR